MAKRLADLAILVILLSLCGAEVQAQETKNSPQASQLEALDKRSQEMFDLGDYVQSLAAAEDAAKLAGQLRAARDKSGPSVANALSMVNWRALFARRFERALEAGDRAAAFDPAELGVQGNRAHALMFAGRAEDALAVYVAHKGEQLADQGKWEDVIAQDFDALQKHGLDHPLMARARKAMAEAPASPRVMLQAGIELANAGRHDDALVALRNYAENVRTRLGESGAEYAEAIMETAKLLRRMNRFAEAEPLMRQALAIDEKITGLEHPGAARDLGALAELMQAAGRFAEAEPLYRRALALDEETFGPEHPLAAARLNNLAELLRVTNRLGEAETLYRRALAIDESVLGPEHPSVAIRLNNLAELLREANHLADAESLCRRALAINEKSYGAENPTVANNLNNLAWLLAETDRLAEAEALYRRALTIDEKAYGPQHASVATILSNLGELLYKTNRLAEAEPLFRRALAADEQSRGPEHPSVAVRLNNLALLLKETGRSSQAEPLFRRALAIDEKGYGAEHPNVARDLNNLALLLKEARRGAEAEPLYRRALAINQKSYGPEHPSVATAQSNLAGFLGDVSRHAEAETLYHRALAIDEKAYGSDHPNVSAILSNLAWLQARQDDWRGALQSIRRSAAISVSSARRLRGFGHAEKRQLAQSADNFRDFVLMAFRAAPADASVREEAFAMAQRSAVNLAADALTQASARLASGDGALAVLARERQDLERQSSALDAQLFDAMGKADGAAAQAVSASQARINARLKEIATRMVREHPDYAAFVDPQPITISAVQALLAPDEVFVQFHDAPSPPSSPIKDAAFAFVIEKNRVRWIEAPLGARALADRVAALRCGLDQDNWRVEKSPGGDGAKDEAGQPGKRARCIQLLGKEVSDNDLPPFDLGRAHALYRDLFGQFEDAVKDKRLLIAASGALAQLPFQALVTEAPAPGDAGDAYAKARWLGASHAISALPSASSLRFLRTAKRSPASDPYIGFGNPLLNGGGLDRRAWERQDCAKLPTAKRPWRWFGRAAPPSLADLYIGDAADVEMLRRVAPLPETADELCTVAHSVGAPDSSVYLGERATVSQIRRLSESGALGRARTVHFATHGLVANETALFVRNGAEPALLMTPPASDKGAAGDDGLLKASDVAELRLNADWVIMSACNTAAADAEGGEALSGLARSFFYAGARTVLVSHWYVDSNAAVDITTGAFAALKAEPAIGRDEALRRSLVAMIAKGGHSAHPAVWAPFSLVGDGGRAVAKMVEAKAVEAKVVEAKTPADPPPVQSASAHIETAPAPVALPAPETPAPAVAPPAQTAAMAKVVPSVAPTAVRASDSPSRVLDYDGPGGPAVFSPGGGHVAAVGPRGEIKVWDLASAAEPRTFAQRSWQTIRALAFSEDGGRILAVTRHGAVTIWDAGTGKLDRKFSGVRGSSKSFAFSADGRLLATTAPDRKSVFIWDMDKGERGGSVPVDDRNKFSQDAVILSPDGRFLAAEQYSRREHALTVGVWEVGSGARKSVMNAHLEDIVSLAFSRDAARLAVVDESGALTVFDAGTGEPQFSIKDSTRATKLAVFSSDGRLLASAGSGREVKLWDAATGRQIKALESGEVNALAFSPDGRLLAAGEDGAIKLWETPALAASASEAAR